MYDIPILFIFFDRQDTTLRVLCAIKDIKPKKLFIYCDGTRDNDFEEKRIIEVRNKVLDFIDWDCDLKVNFERKNKGICLGPYSAIKWFFSFVDKGIVLEHDCLPSSDFFSYCKECLLKYEYTSNIMLIGGNCYQANSKNYDSYYFTKYMYGWGFATWKRVVDKYQIEWEHSDIEILNVVKKRCCCKKEITYWNSIFKPLIRESGSAYTWDYQLLYTIWFYGGLCIAPNQNLVSNIGFGDLGINTGNVDSIFANYPLGNMPILIHPVNIIEDVRRDKSFFDHYLKGKNLILLKMKRFVLKKMGFKNGRLKI